MAAPSPTLTAEPTPATGEVSGALRLEWINLILVGVGVALSYGLWRRWEIIWSFAAGGLLTVLNLRLLKLIVRTLTRPQGIAKGKLIAQVLLKYLGGLGVLAAIMLYLKPQPIAFLAGLSTLVAAVVLEGIIGAFR